MKKFPFFVDISGWKIVVIGAGTIGTRRIRSLLPFGCEITVVAPAAEKVIGVEIVEEAVDAARENAALNQLDNCEFIGGDVLKVLDAIEEKPDFIVLDPPREGIHPKALEKIIKYNVDKMLYISCKPTSLQRDLEVLQARGYKVERLCCVDMFPGTVHVETVVSLGRKKVDGEEISVKTESYV